MAENIESIQPEQEVSMQAPLKSLQDTMNADLVLSDDGRVCIFHDEPLSTRLEYAEFNKENGHIYLVLRWGVLQPFGSAVPEKFREEIALNEFIYLIFGQDGQMKDFYEVKLLTQDRLA